MKKILIVIPVKDEVANLRPMVEEINNLTRDLKYRVAIRFVCDPSNDGSEQELSRLQKVFKNVNFTLTADRAGQAEAIRIGYDFSDADAVITMDADFQDPPPLILKMIEKWEEGFLIVHSKRSDRKSDNFLYRNLMGFGYRVLSNLTDGKVLIHVGDFRLVDKSVVRLFKQFEDPHPFWRAISNLNGIPSTTLEYTRPKRREGKTKYSALIGSPAFALRGLAAFSNRPLRWLQGLGAISSLASVSVLIYCLLAIILDLRFSQTHFMFLTLLFLVLIQFICFAIVATYLNYIVEQVRRRPNYFLKDDKLDK